MNTKAPKISVIMPVYNAEKYIQEAIESILNQTFQDFEFLIINDASSDSSNEIIQSFTDQRIKHISLETNQGLISVLNQGIDLALGKYIARMDADDISEPNRFEKQVKILDSDSSIGICGTWFTLFEPDGTERLIIHPVSHNEITQDLLFNCSIGHPTVMGLTSLFKNNPYNRAFYAAEDYDLWSRLIEQTHFYNIPESLLRYRWHNSNISITKATIQRSNTLRIQQNIWKKRFTSLSGTELEIVLETMLLSETSHISLDKVAKFLDDKILSDLSVNNTILTKEIKIRLNGYYHMRISKFNKREVLNLIKGKYFSKIISFSILKHLLRKIVGI